jgi:hypothetical protein
MEREVSRGSEEKRRVGEREVNEKLESPMKRSHMS